MLDSMAQDEIPLQEQFFPRMDPEPEMATAHGAPPSPPRQSPSPLPSETATGRGDLASSVAAEFCRLGEKFLQMLEEMDNERETNEMKTNAWKERMNDKLEANMRILRGETQSVGQCLQAGIMATPRAETNELGGGSATAVRPAVEAGEDRVIWETC